jgi:predicted TIM-barrel fold metal-dependent hydrolase
VSNPLLGLTPRDPAGPISLPAWLDATVADHLARMDAGGVDQAAIHGGVGYRRTDGLTATREQNDFVATYRSRAPDRLPTAFGVVEPLYAEDSLPEIDRCKELGLTGIGFHPRFQGVSTESPWILRYVDRILELGMLPVLRGMGETPEENLWKVAHVARHFPEHEILVLDVFSTWEGTSEAFDVAEECPNLTFNTALAYDYDMVEPFIQVVGSRRVVFGSDLHHPAPPRPVPGAIRDKFTRAGRMLPPMRISHFKDQLLASSLPNEQKHDVLWGNAMRLFGLNEPAGDGGSDAR